MCGRMGLLEKDLVKAGSNRNHLMLNVPVY